jgi:hypothetical protein
MADNTPRDLLGAHRQGPQEEQTPDMPVRLIRGNASPEELSALIAVVAVLTSMGSDDRDSADVQRERPSWGSGSSSRSHWSSAARMVRKTHPHGPGGWRASASPAG